jgi:hypothetical protein
MTDLIKRLKEAETGSRELDALMWPLHPGFKRMRGTHFHDDDKEKAWRAIAAPAYTTSLDAALALAERVLPGWSWMVRHYAAGQGGRGWTAYVCKPDTDLVSAGPVGSSPALALCIAILKATDTGRE